MKFLPRHHPLEIADASRRIVIISIAPAADPAAADSACLALNADCRLHQ
jgi:hypothetical protein